MSVPGDNPIETPEEDALGRASIARSFAGQILSLDSREGLVVGVLGPWGSGKTSFINLARDDLSKAGAAVLDFNPWMFSGAEQLVESFFIELAAQLKLRPGLGDIGKDLEDYGEAFSGMAWLPLVGPWIERGRLASKLLSKMLQRRKEGVGGRRAKLSDALGRLDQPIFVVLDDIDRLSTSEIRDVFKLVRLTASFPNIIYVVAFDRLRVEQALSEQGVPGRDYLEKILQLAIDLPSIPSHVLNREVFSALDAVLNKIENPGRLDEEVWPDVFMEVIRPLIRNMRDVRRYAAAVQGTVRALDGEIALADVLALEAVRLFLPDVFSALPASVEGLTSTSAPFGGASDPPRLKKQVEALIEAAGPQPELVQAMILRLFPAGQRHVGGSYYGPDWQQRWFRERRIAHEEILRLYLERVAGRTLRAFREAERAWAVMTDRDAFEAHLRSLEPDQLEEIIGSLEAYEGDFSTEHIVPATIVLLNLLPELPERPRGIFDLDTRLVVGRVTYRLLRTAGSSKAIEEAAREIIPALTSLSSKLEVITDIGHREGAGHKLVAQEVAAELEKAWRDEVRAKTVEDLLKEHDLVRILLVTKREADSSEDALTLPESPELTYALIRGARSDARSQTLGSRAVRRVPRLAWDVLIELIGDEQTLKDRLDALAASGIETDEELLDLARQYAAGWRPGDDDDNQEGPNAMSPGAKGDAGAE